MLLAGCASGCEAVAGHRHRLAARAAMGLPSLIVPVVIGVIRSSRALLAQQGADDGDLTKLATGAPPWHSLAWPLPYRPKVCASGRMTIRRGIPTVNGSTTNVQKGVKYSLTKCKARLAMRAVDIQRSPDASSAEP